MFRDTRKYAINHLNRRAILKRALAIAGSMTLWPVNSIWESKLIVGIKNDLSPLDFKTRNSEYLVRDICTRLNQQQIGILFLPESVCSDKADFLCNYGPVSTGVFQEKILSYSPMGLDAKTQLKWLWSEEGLEFLHTSTNNQIIFPAGSTGPIAGFWLQKPLLNFKDIEIAAPKDSKEFLDLLGLSGSFYSYDNLKDINKYFSNTQGFIGLMPSFDIQANAPGHFPLYYSSSWENYQRASSTNYYLTFPTDLLQVLSANDLKKIKVSMKTFSLQATNHAIVQETLALDILRKNSNVQMEYFPKNILNLISDLMMDHELPFLKNGPNQYKKLLNKTPFEIII